jgi:hypothetical protein
MSQSDQFRQYAEEALLSVRQSKDENEKKALLDLAHVWVLAAFQSERDEAACKTVVRKHRAALYQIPTITILPA